MKTLEIIYAIETQNDSTGNICRTALEKGVSFTPLSKEHDWALFQAECDRRNYGFVFGSTQKILDNIPEYCDIVWKETKDLTLVSNFGSWGSLETFVLHNKGIASKI